jgi:hypothetical protein
MAEGTDFWVEGSDSSVDNRTISAANWLGSLGSFLLERLMQPVWHKAEMKEKEELWH